MIYVRDGVDDMYSHSAEVKSRSEDASKPVRTSAVKMVAPEKNILINSSCYT